MLEKKSFRKSNILAKKLLEKRKTKKIKNE